jgi:protein-disulfide isomerase
MTREKSLSILLALSFIASAAGAVEAPAPATATVANGAAVEIPTVSAPFNTMGNAHAPVAIVEFSDLQCPYCASYALQTFPQLKRTYVDTGEVKYAAIDFPLSIHAYAMAAAVAARCAGEQGRYWQYRDAVFSNQARLGEAPYDQLARDLGLDVTRFDTCRADGKQEAAVRAGIRDANANGIAETPSFMIGRFVNGRFEGETLSGARPFDEFAAKIDALLREAK